MECVIRPTEGGYQKCRKGAIVRETKTKFVVQVEGDPVIWGFSKKDMLRTGSDNYAFPRYELQVESQTG